MILFFHFVLDLLYFLYLQLYYQYFQGNLNHLNSILYLNYKLYSNKYLYYLLLYYNNP